MAPGAAGQRLPGGVTPQHYALTITPDLKGALFTGVETIDVIAEHPADAITLNAAEIAFSSASVRSAAMGAAERKAVVTKDPERQQATLHLAQTLPAGPATLTIAFSGTLNDKLRGFYLSKAKTRSYGVTQFEATDARRAFPSFDEPALKATFDVSLVVDSGDTAISNTPVVSDTPGPVPGKHTLRFATTPKMSTYLVAWLVGDWACTQGKSEGVPIRVCATPDKVRLTRFALDAAKWDLKYFDRYFGIKYPMAKMDLVAIPDFEAGAMENFGCLTFRETELLVEEKDGALAARKQVASTVAHEIAHQWFGDMVTMQWWDNLWLNEGFATWMETKAAAHWKPEWRFEQDVAVELDGTMDLDEEPTTRAMRAQAETPAEIDEMFDGIAYGKAGAVIGMVENWIGEEVFRRGVHEYLAAHLYGNATAEDFWNTQTRVSGLPVDQVMRSFVEQPGVPVVSLGEAGPGGVPVRQSRLLLPGEAGGDPTAGESWTLPLCFKSSGCRVISPATLAISVEPDTLLFADAADKGYFRTNYTARQMDALRPQVETRLTAPERIGLLSDRWALMRCGMGSVGDYLDLAFAVKTDSNATVIDTALGKVEAVGNIIASGEDRVRLNAVIRSEFGPVYAALAGSGRKDRDGGELRSTLYEVLGEAGDPGVLAQAQKITADLFAGRRPADASVADASVALTARHGDSGMYDKMMAVAQTATDPGLKADALHLLTRFDEPLLVIRTLEYAVSDEVRSQDSWTLIALLLERRETQDLAWQYLEQHWTAVSRKLTVNAGAKIVEASGSFCSTGKRDNVQQFFTTHPVASERTLRKSLESIAGCMRLREAQEPRLRQWLDAHAGAAPPT
ncbi:MAG: ERAP1-like C-terminal domain-containing protein [Acidobacteriota bacterium]|nr:ERAP1-like C-terminal domain-containing protein [Acidobacteriota bacterium]